MSFKLWDISKLMKFIIVKGTQHVYTKKRPGERQYNFFKLYLVKETEKIKRMYGRATFKHIDHFSRISWNTGGFSYQRLVLVAESGVHLRWWREGPGCSEMTTNKPTSSQLVMKLCWRRVLENPWFYCF